MILALLSFSGCSATSNGTSAASASDSAYHKITAEEAKSIMDEGGEYIVVDVRTAEEYDESHIPGSILIPNETIVDEPIELLQDKNQKILIYCRSGNRSHQAALKLVDMGYTDIYDFGGIIDWPYETISEQN